MNILVCISSVPDTTSKINFKNNNQEFDDNGVQFVINPYDEFGLTKSVMLKQELGAKVTVLSVGGPTFDPILRKALAIGADEAVRINMNPLDSFVVANEVSNYINDNEFDLIICGRESIDYNGGAVPGMVSELLSMPFVNACIGLAVEGSKVILIREIDGGKETVSINFPAIIAGQKGLVEESELLIPNMRGIMQSRSKPLSVLEPSDQEIRTNSVSFSLPDKKQDCTMIDKNNVEDLVNLLHNEAKVI